MGPGLVGVPTKATVQPLAWELDRAQQLASDARAQCDRRTIERDQAIAAEASMGLELGRALAQRDALLVDLDAATELLSSSMELAKQHGEEEFHRSIDEWMRADTSLARRRHTPDPSVLLRALLLAIDTAEYRDLNRLGARLNAPRREGEENRAYRSRLRARLGVEA